MPLTLPQLNAASPEEAAALLDGLYEHSPWIAQRALARRPFVSLAQLKRAMVEVLHEAGRDAQLTLIRAHPELAGKAMVSKTLTAESTNEQGKAGLTDCTPDEFARIQQLNADYNAKFGFPFILAVRGPRGTGLSRHEIIDTFAEAFPIKAARLIITADSLRWATTAATVMWALSPAASPVTFTGTTTSVLDLTLSGRVAVTASVRSD